MPYQLRCPARNSLTGSTPSRTGNTASIHHRIADRTSPGSAGSWSYLTDAAPTMAKLRNSSRLVDLSPSSRMRASRASTSRSAGSWGTVGRPSGGDGKPGQHIREEKIVENAGGRQPGRQEAAIVLPVGEGVCGPPGTAGAMGARAAE